MQVSSDQIIQVAARFVNQTSRTIFLTGKAGTGKTTFIRDIVSRTHKNAIVAAPTGIAAINAGGVTLHSLFQLPFASFIPLDKTLSDSHSSIALHTPKSLLQSFQMNKAKRNMLRELELLIIDEVSMLRADLLDAIDVILRHVRYNRNQAFGGVQVLFIGDLLQLPPVVKDEEWRHLSLYYKGMHFFNAKVLQQQPPLYIELDKIYRQSDPVFIQLLNNLRDNCCTNVDFELLNTHFIPDFGQSEFDGYVLLTTHNRIADAKNLETLQKLKATSFQFEAEVEGDFSEYLYPVDKKLVLKQGAQVMMLKNDYSGEQRFFNGKIGRVSSLKKDEIIVSFSDGTDPVMIEPYTWENKKFSLNKETNAIDETVVGRFKHFPIKLAWAITVHKSQGLTFEKAIIDVENAFAPGQIYVALSRLTSLDGLVLSSPIPRNLLQPDSALSEFSILKSEPGHLQTIFVQETRKYLQSVISQAFDFSYLSRELSFHLANYNKDENRSLKQQYKEWALGIIETTAPLQQTALSFTRQIQTILADEAVQYSYLLERLNAAKLYFEPRLQEISDKVYEHIMELGNEKGIKKYRSDLYELDALFQRQIQHIYKAVSLLEASMTKSEFTKDNLQRSTPESKIKREKRTKPPRKAKLKKEKREKIDTKAVSFELYQKGKSINEIAIERGLSHTTIEGHLAHYVRLGTIGVQSFISPQRLQAVRKLVDELETVNLAPLKEELDSSYSYTELRMAVAAIMAEREQALN